MTTPLVVGWVREAGRPWHRHVDLSALAAFDDPSLIRSACGSYLAGSHTRTRVIETIPDGQPTGLRCTRNGCRDSD